MSIVHFVEVFSLEEMHDSFVGAIRKLSVLERCPY